MGHFWEGNFFAPHPRAPKMAANTLIKTCKINVMIYVIGKGNLGHLSKGKRKIVNIYILILWKIPKTIYIPDKIT